LHRDPVSARAVLYGSRRQGNAAQAAQANRNDTMSSFVETWKGIAHALGRSERWCRYMARRTSDPLPVFKVGGIVRLNATDLNDWLSHQRDRSLGRPLGEGFMDSDERAFSLVA
jgi:hypothetical protein